MAANYSMCWGFDISTKAFRGSNFDYQRVCMEHMSVIKKALSSV